MLSLLSWHTHLDLQTTKLSVQLQSEQFLRDRVMVVLEWMVSDTLLSRYPQLLLSVSVDVVPDRDVETMFFGSMRVHLTLLYNTLYNVSIIQPAICEQLSQAAYIKLNYSKFYVIEYHNNVLSKLYHVGKCFDPLTLANDGVIVDGYEGPALKGGNIIFSCRDGLTLIGPNSATCMGNGEWEPDLSDVECTGGSVTMLRMS